MLRHKNISVLFLLLFALFLIVSFYTEAKTGWLVGVFLFWLAVTTWGVFDIRAGYFIKTYCGKSGITSKKIAITFDDGPTIVTPAVLDVLRKFNVRATFFCIGIQIEKHPDIFKQIIADGHILGNHSYSHSNSIGFFSAEKVVGEIQKNDQIISSFLGKKPLFYRPPFGVTNPNIAKALAKTGHYTIGWNNRSLDTVISDDRKILKRIKSRINPGGIILLHDTSEKTVSVLEQLLLFLHSENYQVTPLDELINLKAYEE